MEWILFGLLVWWFYSRSKKKEAKTFQEVKIDSKAQREYEKFMASLPFLAGDGSFSQEIKGEQAYADTINLFGEYLRQFHPGESEFAVMVELEPSNKHDPNAVRVDAGQATVGYIPREEAEQFGEELAVFGGRASCKASLFWSPDDGRSSITLDVVRPLRTN